MENNVIELPSFQPLPPHLRADRARGELVVFQPSRREQPLLPSKYTVVLHPPPQPSRGLGRAFLVTVLAAAGVFGYCVQLDPDNAPPTMLSVEVPVAAPVQPAPQQTPIRKVPTQAHIDAVRRGEYLLLMGDIIGARSFFAFAYDGGLTYAAKWVARTYDPDYLAKVAVGFRGDRTKAQEWYSKAAEDSAPLPPHP